MHSQAGQVCAQRYAKQNQLIAKTWKGREQKYDIRDLNNIILIIIMKVNTQAQIKKQLNDNLYKQVQQVKITFDFLHIAIPNDKKLVYYFPPTARLLEVKKRLDEETNRKFVFYLRQSFIPSLDSAVGDIALCYGRKQSQTKYELKLAASQNTSEFG